MSDQNLTTVAGKLGVPGYTDGSEVLLRDPNGLALDESRQELYVADQGNHVVRRIDLTTGFISTISPVGPDSLKSPSGLALAETLFERVLYIADSGNHQIRKLDLVTGNLSVAAPAFFEHAAGLAFDKLNGILYVADQGVHAVFSLDMTLASPAAGLVAGQPGYPGGPGDGSTFMSHALKAQLNRPDGLALDSQGQRLYIGDATKAIRMVDLTNQNMTLAAIRSSFQHETGHLGPIGLALGNTTIPGFKVESIYHRPLEGGPPQFGNYFYFRSSMGYAGGSRPRSSWECERTIPIDAGTVTLRLVPFQNFSSLLFSS